ncbi:hypothetical protein Bbelb_302860 [Branchiostoma belcheri]|nr:hypothetical protein Bbelb_302860 [Branchiostoma belcheri]
MAASKMNRRIVFQGYDTVSCSTYIEQQKNPNTKRKTESDIQHFLLFLGANGEERRPEDISAAELDERLGMFFLGIRKDNGEDYEPDSLTSKHRSIARYLREKGYQEDILVDKTFAHSRECLVAKRKSLKKEGRGNKPNRADPLSAAEEKIEPNQWALAEEHNAVWDEVQDGTLQHALGDVEETTDSQGRIVLEFSERATKKRTGITSDSRPFKPRAYACPESQACPVNLYREYRKRRPVSQMHPTAPFYLGINRARKPG